MVIIGIEALSNLGDIGDTSSGITGQFDTEGIIFRMDGVFFRRSEVGAFIIVQYLDEDLHLAQLPSIARQLDDRIAQALSESPPP